MEISETEKRELEACLATLPTRRAALLPALGLFQRKRGFIDDEAVRGIARLLDLSHEEVLEVATFYHFVCRRPVGEKVIKVCRNVSCCMAGADRLFESLEERLGIRDGESTGDGRFSLIGTACLGRCEQAPVILINDEVHGGMTEDRIEEICSSQSS